MKETKVYPIWKTVLILVLLFLVTFFTTAVAWALCSWSMLTMDELLWHLKASMKGSNPDMVISFIVITLGVSVLVTGIAAFLLIRSRRRKESNIFLSRITLGATAAILVGGLIAAWNGFSIGPFLKGYMTVSSFIEDEYVDPGSVAVTFPEKKRNVIVLYLESMELTFTDPESGGAFPENVIPELTQLARENECFAGDAKVLNGGIALPGTVWTMGAMFGTTAGLPLKTPLGQNGMSVNDDFLPGIMTLGDLLEREGYRNRLLIGSEAIFGGREQYYRDHGNHEIHDYHYAIDTGRIPEDYMVWWGYEDEKLFDYAKEELTELAKGDQPFSMSILTADTHFEDGHLCPRCGNTFGSNRYANIMNCSSGRVAEFVQWLKEQDFYQDTTIIITGDHPTMDTDFCDDVPESYLRKTYTCIINSVAEAKNPARTRVYSTFDLFPTTLAAMGVTLEGDRLGLGTNLYSDRDTLTERYTLPDLEEKLNARSKMMERMYNGSYVSPAKKESTGD